MWIDITLLIIAVIGFWKGWQKGLIISIFSSIAWVIGFIGALKLSAVASVMLRDRLGWDSRYTPIVSFILIFIIIVFIVYLIGKILDKLFEVAQLGILNKMLGAILKLIVFMLLFSMFIWLFNQAGFISPETKTHSKTYTSLLSLADHTIEFFGSNLPTIKNIFNDIEHFFEDLADKAQQTM
jgi:membrane protein required for colicin V production